MEAGGITQHIGAFLGMIYLSDNPIVYVYSANRRLMGAIIYYVIYLDLECKL